MLKDESNLLAILGPTNTGKTHLAFNKMLSYNSGIFGFPLRLLARENYDKAVKKIGFNLVALITGEEKIHPKEARYFFCTVESMPSNIESECVIIDEIQLAADYERGYIFTERLLNFRGSYQTIFLGSLTIKNILIKLFPNIKFEYLKRFSKLSYLPKQNLSKLKPRSAVIAFNINKVYEIAEILRTYKGGAAVILGSLSPRTRNSQVEVYEDKKVDYLVATDAIGMGLNMDIEQVSFSNLKKFDGKKTRRLRTTEISQIAGRAGRYKVDGSFGVTGGCENLEPDEIERIESHKLHDIKFLFWRNSNLNFERPENLIQSLEEKPTSKYFSKISDSLDENVLKYLVRDKKLKFSNDKLDLLWECCQIPDFQKKAFTHIDVVTKVFNFLNSKKSRIPNDYMKNQLIKQTLFVVMDLKDRPIDTKI